MAWLRMVIRALLLGSVYAGYAVLGALVHLAFYDAPRSRNRILTALSNQLGQWSCLICNIRVRVVGKIHRRANALIVANHVGTPDILTLGSCLPTFFVAKSDFRDWPLMGPLFKLGATIFVDRTRKHLIKGLNDTVLERLREGHSVVLFPEAGVTDGQSVAPFKTSPFQPAIDAGRPVIPVAIVYHDGNIPSVASWHGVSFYQHLSDLLRFPRLDATLVFLPPLVDVSDRRALADESHRLISSARAKFGENCQPGPSTMV